MGARPAARMIVDPRSAELAARDWMSYLGFQHARVTVVGPDEGVDVDSEEAVAQVKSGTSPTGRPVVQQIYGISELKDKEAFLFTVGGVTDQAAAWANEAGVAIFQMDLAGDVRPLNSHAATALSNAPGPSDGWLLVIEILERNLELGKDAAVTAEFTAPGGFHGYWGVWVRGDGTIRATRDFAGSTSQLVATVAAGINLIATGLDDIRASYWDSHPVLTVDGVSQPLLRASLTPEPPLVPLVVDPPESDPVVVTASDIYALLNGPQCDRRIYWSAHGVPGAEKSALQIMLIEAGLRHEAEYFESLSEAVDLSHGTLAERSSATRQAIDDGGEIIYQGALSVDRSIGPYKVDLIGVPDFLIPEAGAHVIRDAKTAINVDEDDRPDIAGQLRFYGLLYQQVVGRPPAGLEVLAGDDQIHRIDYEGPDDVFEVVKRVVALKRADKEPSCYVKWSYGSTCPYFDRCWVEAVDRGAVSTIPGVTAAAAEVLTEAGVASIDELLRIHTVASLAEVRVPYGDRTKKLGKRAEKILRAARALSTNLPIVYAAVQLDDASNVVLFDLEGAPSLAGGFGQIYLWGTAVHGEQPREYQAVFAKSADSEGDRIGWEAFLARARQIIDDYGPIPWMHWASYERSQLHTYIEAYGDRDGTANEILGLLVDLLRVTRNAVALPVPSYSLKVVEDYVGFERSQSEYGGDWSIVKWQEALAASSQQDSDALLGELATYNREDLEGMAAVYEFLRGFD